MSSEKPALKPKPKIPPPIKAKKPDLTVVTAPEPADEENVVASWRNSLKKTEPQLSPKTEHKPAPKPTEPVRTSFSAVASKFPPPPVHINRNKSQASIKLERTPSTTPSLPEGQRSSTVSSKTPLSSDDEDAPPLPSRPSRGNSVSSVEEDAPPLPKRPGISPQHSVVQELKTRAPPKPRVLERSDSQKSATPPPRPERKGTPPVVKPKPALKPKPVPESFTNTLTSNLETLKLQQQRPNHSAPPTPPKSRSSAFNSGTASPASPAPRSRSKPSVPPPRSAAKSNWHPPVLNLELDSGWFAKDDFENYLPKDLQNLDYATSYGYNSKENFRVLVFRNRDLSTTKIKFTWDKAGDPAQSADHETKFVPPPQASKALLDEGAAVYGEHVAGWSEAQKGKKVGDGECWTLAHEALKRGCGKHAFISSGLVHGALLGTIVVNDKKPKFQKEPVSSNIQRGDILQFKDCCIRYPNKALFYGSPDHTSVVTHVTGSVELPKVDVLHQNVNGEKVVILETLELDKLVEGEVKVYRPVAASWISELTPMW
ncbi:hypothetical protein OGAPHI_005001 [Ogataea philodendri]|uniref:BBC1/AIM3 cysteine proteinase-fold domain-containing protein n=1 Tax=Ogataea philodendri TaxID=1378263 RepID=A0A9P8P1K7_9ASCO|nr:uncharacterized protein OGAPHI_005001 [Ogataea philodendri]KAH3663600.1 hypothetical protein OGAPHI_005001 [Ogataea philodendri]